MSEMSAEAIRRIRDTFESEALLAGTEIIYCEGAWCCGCEGDRARWAVANVDRPLVFAHCYLCSAGAIVTLWTSEEAD